MGELHVDNQVLQNLKDAGCDEDTISCFVSCSEIGCDQDQFILLKKHRRCLLDKMHEDQKQIDCLDYLVDKMKKEK